MNRLDRNVVLITHKTAVDATCAGQKTPRESWMATVYIHSGHHWQAAFPAEAAIVDPAAPAVQPLGERGGNQLPSGSGEQAARTAVLSQREESVWEAWKDRDAKRLDALTSGEMQFINIFGVPLATKAEALKNWSGEGCDVKTVTLGNAAATMLSPSVGLLTFQAAPDGTCFAQKVGRIWGSSIYVKHGDTGLWNFGINLPAH